MAVRTQDIPYSDGSVSCLGFFAVDAAQSGKRPGVLVIPEAFGLGRHAMDRAKMLSEEGYAAFAADLHGDRREARAREELGAALAPFIADPSALRRRVRAGLDALAARPEADRERLFAIGFCFGGMAALELARDGCDLLGVVGFHSTLETKAPAGRSRLKASILVQLGSEDPIVPPAQRAAFEAEMRAAGADWQMIVYGGVRHSFTNPAADGSYMPDVVYDRQADERSWRRMLDFLEERLKA